MGMTLEEYRKESNRKFVQSLTPNERLEGLSPRERLPGLSGDEIRAYLQQLETTKRRLGRRRIRLNVQVVPRHL